ncbi:hypothetical protein BGZ52_010204 [Haplosporangium bisporale]|nr:hypothetical protein BGZ52_010204 [Haplosporangium bisporale]
MENKQSGLVTPPIVSPKPIQSLPSSHISTPAINDSWKTVRFPPRRPLVSPPAEQQRQSNEREHSQPQSPSQTSKDMNEANSTNKAKAKSQTKDPSEGSERGDRVQEEHDETASTITRPREIHASMLRDKDKHTHGQEVRTHQSLSSSITLGHTSTAASTSPPSTSSASSIYNSSGDEKDKLERSPLPHDAVVSTPYRPPGLSLNTGAVTMSTTSRSGLESPLSMSSCIWTGRVSEDINPRAPSAYSTNSSITNRGTPKLGLENDVGLRQGDPSAQGIYANRRSLSFSEPGGYSGGMSLNSPGFSLQNENSMGSFRVPPSILEEDPDEIEPRASRTRSHSTSATFGSGGLYSNFMRNSFDNHESQDPFAPRSPSNSMGLFPGQDRHPLHNQLNSGPTWVGPWHTMHDPIGGSSRRRSMTGEYTAPVWESQGSYSPMTAAGEPGYGERQRPMRRYSVAPSSGFQTQSLDNEYNYPQRRHSVAGPSASYLQPNPSRFNLNNALDNLHLEDDSNNWATEEIIDQMGYQGQDYGMVNMGKPMTLNQISRHGLLYVVEFKAGRRDLFYSTKSSGLQLRRGDLVMVEADRGKDLGKITDDSITPQAVQVLQIKTAEEAVTASLGQPDGGIRMPKEIHPKRIFRLAHTTEVALLETKNQDEEKAKMVCQAKVRQKKLPMEVVAAEYQWDRRKLTFFFKAERRIDFRELVRELFKIYKTRIWMYAVNQAATNSPESVGEVENEAVTSTSVSTATTAPIASPASTPPEASVQYLQQHLPNDQAKRSYHQPQSYMSPTETRPDFRGMSTPFAGMQQDQGHYSHHAFVHSVGIDG